MTTKQISKSKTAKAVSKVANKSTKKASAKPKVAKKPTVKKAVSKKKKVASKKAPVQKKISPDQYFYLNNGQVLKDINHLAGLMDELEDEIFHHHVTEQRNDFASWIENVFEEAELANQLMQEERNKEKHHYIILKYVVKKGK